MAYTEDNMQKALQKFNQGGHSLRAVAHEFGIPRSTLRNRLDGHRHRSVAFERLQILTRLQEVRLTQWVSAQVDLGVPPTQVQIQEFACRILRAQGDSRVVGKNWINRFMARHSIVLSAKAGKKDEVDADHDKEASVEEDEPETPGSDTSCIVVRSNRSKRR
jgi:4-hydroxybenzoate polyprenyltransferase